MSAKTSIKKIFNSISNDKFSLSYRSDFNWDEIFFNCSPQVVFYRSHYIEFATECLRGNDILCVDFSLGIKLDGKIIALFPLFYIENKNKKILGFLEDTICPPIFINSISKKIKKEVSGLLVEKLKSLFLKLNINNPIISDQLWPSNSLSIWHKSILNHSKKCAVIRELFLNLNSDYSKTRSYYRKSYKALISKADKLFKPFKLEENDKVAWNEFRILHYNSAGRKTRSDRSWELLFHEIKEGKSDLYFCRDIDGIMRGGSFVMKSNLEAFYAVAAYDRDFFHLPIGHYLQDFIIKDLLKTNIQWYRFGRLYKKSDFDMPNDKQIQIGQFKAGFSSDLIANYRFSGF
mgnify:FL=1